MKLFFLYLALLAAACAVLLLVDDPSRSGWLPECLFYKTTGYLCYGCGSTRALHALLHGHWLDSLRYNVLLVPTLIWLGTLFFIRDKTVFLRVLTAGVAVLALFTVARNIPLSRRPLFSGFRLLRACRNFDRVRHETLKISSRHCPIL